MSAVSAMRMRGNRPLSRRKFACLLGTACASVALGVVSGCSGEGANEDAGGATSGPAAPPTDEGSQDVRKDEATATSAGQAPEALAAGTVCVAEYAGNTLAIIDPGTWTVVDHVPAGQNPATALFVAGSVYVGSSGGGELAVVSAANPQAAMHIPVGRQPLGLCYDEARGILYVGDYFNNSIHEVDVALNSLVGTIALDVCGYHKRTDPPDCCRIGPGEGRRTVAMALSPQGETLYCANYGTYDVARIDLEAGQEIEAFDGVVGPRQMVVSHDGASLLLAGVGGEEEEQVNALYVIDRQTGKRVREVPVGQSVAGVAQSSDGAVVYALARDDGELVAFDAADWKERGRLAVGTGADTLFLDAGGRQAYVANSATGVLTVVDASALEVIAQVEGLASPKGIAVVE